MGNHHRRGHVHRGESGRVVDDGMNETIEWISVGERLPQVPDGNHESSPVLVRCDGYRDFPPLVGTAALSASMLAHSPLRWVHHNGDEFDRNVTHWAEMPKGPQKAASDG